MLEEAFQRELKTALELDVYNKYPKLHQSLMEKRFSISDAQVSHRLITYWEAKGILPDTNEKGKWRTFDFVEYVWLKIIVKLREFNVGLDSIKKVKEVLLRTEPNILS